MSEQAKKYLDGELEIDSHEVLIYSYINGNSRDVKVLTAIDMAQIMEDYANSKT